MGALCSLSTPFFVFLCSAFKLFGCVPLAIHSQNRYQNIFLSNIEALEHEAVIDAIRQLTMKTIDFGKVFPALEEGQLEEKPHSPPLLSKSAISYSKNSRKNLDENDRPKI